MTGTSGRQRVQTDVVKQHEFLFPPLSEQRAIASVLSSLDDKIDLLHRQNKTLEAMAETLFRQWFVEEADEGWEEGVLDEVLSVKGGTTPSTKNSEYWDGEIHWTTPRDLSNNQHIYLFDTERKITEKGLAKISSGLLPVGTILLSSRAPIGYLAITDIPVAINQGYIAIIDNKGYSKYYLYLWVKNNVDYIISNANGSTFLEISKSVFRSLEILKPPADLRGNFDKHVIPIFQKIKTNSKPNPHPRKTAGYAAAEADEGGGSGWSRRGDENMKLFVKIGLFLSSYFPLFLILALRDWFNLWAWILVIVVGIFCIFIWLLLFRVSKSRTSEKYKIINSENRVRDSLNYLVPYIIAFMNFDLNRWQDSTALALLLYILFVVYVNSNLLYVNPLLSIFKYKIYYAEVTKPYISDREEIVIITTREHIRKDTMIDVKEINKDVFLEVMK